MKKSKKYISIIIPALALLFISFGLFFSSNLIVSAREEDDTLKYSVNEQDIPGTRGTAGGIPGTFRGGGSSDDSTNDDDTGDENTGDTATKTVSDSITVLVEDPDDDDEKPVCSQNTYQCEKGNATNMKTTEGPTQFVYIWNCELNDETKGCADPMPTCGDFSYKEGNKWTGGCDGGYTAEKNYNKETNTYTWQCRGSLGDPIRECSHKPKDGQCKYIEDYYPRSGSYDPSKIFLCEGEGVKSINHRVDNEKEIVYWDCPGEEGGKTDSCSKLIYASAICGDEPGECFKGVFVEGSLNYWSDETVQSWKCQGVNGGTPDGLYKNISTCYPDDDGGDDNGGDIIIDGQCADKLGECLSGEKTSVTTDEKGNSYWQCLGSEKGGKDDICEELKSPENGVCGEERYECEVGTLDQTKSLLDKYTWVCKSENGGKDDICEELKIPENGVCGEERYECEVGTLDQTKSLLDKYTWVCEGLHGGETETCSIPKTINPDNECKGLCKLFENFGKTLKINYPFSDIKLKVDGGEVASSRAWAVCGTGLYWDNESGTCLKPECPEEPDYPEPETPYWTYEYDGKCIISGGEDEGKLTVTGTCQNYNQEEGMFCQEADGGDWPSKTKYIKYDCFRNPPQDIELTVELWAEKENGIPNTESNLVTETQFKIHWKATTKPSGKVTSCDKIKTPSDPSLGDIETGGAAAGVKEAYHPGVPQNTVYSITCYDKNGDSKTATTKVFFGEIDSNVAEV